MLRVKRLHENGQVPRKAHAGDLGYDLFALEATQLLPDETRLVRTGIAVGLPAGYGAFIKDRSSVATKQDLFTVAGVIDNGYTGEILIAMHNAGYDPCQISAGQKIAQMVLIPTVDFAVEEVAEDLVGDDGRGTSGFGSTGGFV